MVAGRWSLVATCLLPAVSAAEPSPALVLHITPASYSGCTTIDVASMSCEDIVVEGDNSTQQFAFVLTSHIDAIGAVEFGVDYPSSVGTLSWSLCTGGSEIPENTWPATQTGNIVTWPSPPHEPSDTDSLAVVGYFAVPSGATGVLSLAADPRIEEAMWVDSGLVENAFDVALLGAVDVNGQGGGTDPCGAGTAESSGGGEEEEDDAPPQEGGSEEEDSAASTYAEVVIMMATDIFDVSDPYEAIDVSSDTVSSAALREVFSEYGVTSVERAVPTFETEDRFATARGGAEVVLTDWSKLYRLHGWSREEGYALALALETVGVVGSAYHRVMGGPSTRWYPNDALFQSGDQWNLSSTTSYSDPLSAPEDDPDIDAPEAWHYSRGAGVTVLVSDEGFDDAHEDLGGNIHALSDTAQADSSGHGYNVASVVSARTDNVVGIAGVAPEATLCSQYKFAGGIPWDPAYLFGSGGIGAAAANYSYVLRGSRQFFRDAYAMNAILVVASGNLPSTCLGDSAGESKGTETWPGQTGVLIVGGIDQSGDVWSGSCPTATMDVAAPSIDVPVAAYRDASDACSAFLDSTCYKLAGGTSVAAPAVAGIVALLLSENPSLNVDDVEQLIKLSATNVPVAGEGASGWDSESGWGYVSASRAFSIQRYPYGLIHGFATGGTIVDTSDVFEMRMYSTPGYTDAEIVEASLIEVHAYADWSNNEEGIVPEEIVAVWGRGAGVMGSGLAAPEPEVPPIPPKTQPRFWNQPWCQPIKNTVTATGCSLRTYMYHVYEGSSWDPIPTSAFPAGLKLHYAVLANVDTAVVNVSSTANSGGPGRADLRLVSASGTSFDFAIDLDVRSLSTVRVFDVGGRLVRTLHDGLLAAGRSRLTWQGKDEHGRSVAAGVYFVQLRTPAGVAVSRVVSIR